MAADRRQPCAWRKTPAGTVLAVVSFLTNIARLVLELVGHHDGS
ncbi:hypothetical protein [Streptomyces sp. NPDC002537]